METTLNYAEKMLALLNGSPEMKAVIDREKRQAADAEKQARLDCLARVKTLEPIVIETKQKLDSVLGAIAAAQIKVNELKTKAAPTATAHTKAQADYTQAITELNQLHGEGVIFNTLHRLDRFIKDTEIHIQDLERSKNSSNRDVDGNLIFRPVSPNIALNQKILKQRLDVFQKLYLKTKEFINADMAPSEIKELCESVCKATVQLTQPNKATA